MFRTNFVIPGSTVLQQVVISVFGIILPLGGHLCGCLGEVVFSAQIVPVVRLIYRLNIFQELLKWLSIAVFVQQRWEGFVQFVECLHSGEHPVGILKMLPKCVGHLRGLET